MRNVASDVDGIPEGLDHDKAARVIPMRLPTPSLVCSPRLWNSSLGASVPAAI
jgi:hypothetical protein